MGYWGIFFDIRHISHPQWSSVAHDSTDAIVPMCQSHLSSVHPGRDTRRPWLCGSVAAWHDPLSAPHGICSITVWKEPRLTSPFTTKLALRAVTRKCSRQSSVVTLSVLRCILVGSVVVKYGKSALVQTNIIIMCSSSVNANLISDLIRVCSPI